MLTEKDIFFANILNHILAKTAKDNQMPNCDFLMRCAIIESQNSLEEDFIEYKKKSMQGWLCDDSTDILKKVLDYFTDGIHIKEIQYQDLLYSPLDDGKSYCSLATFTSWFYSNNFDIENIPETIEFTGINPSRKNVLDLIHEYFGENTMLSYYTLIDAPNELFNGYLFSHCHHWFICSSDRILVFEFEMCH